MIHVLGQSDIRIIENFGGLEWANQTTIHPVGLAMTALCGIAAVLVPRQYAIWPFVLMACFIAPAQRLVVGGLDFNLMRLMTIFGFARVFLRSEARGMRWLPVDFCVLIFAGVRTIAFTIQNSSMPAFIQQGGQTFDTVGLYFLARMLVRNWDDVVRVAAGFAVIAIPVAAAFALENLTGRNVFSAFGGVPAVTAVREGRLRCQGAFAHPIIAGCFWASVLPLILAMWWWRPGLRPLALAGAFCSLVIIALTSSSTPVMGVLFAAFGGAMFFLRRHMGLILLLTLGLMVALHLSMKAPIWHLISRITIARGNTGHHRFLLIDNAIHRFGEWWFVGTPSTAHWFWGGQDVTNQYVLEGVRGGFLTLLLFVLIIVLSFRAVGRVWRIWSWDRPRLFMSWALGVSLFVHCTNFIAVSYFGQGTFIWYLLLGMIGSMLEWSVLVDRMRARRRAAAQVQALSLAPGLAGAGRATPLERGGAT